MKTCILTQELYFDPVAVPSGCYFCRVFGNESPAAAAKSLVELVLAKMDFCWIATATSAAWWCQVGQRIRCVVTYVIGEYDVGKTNTLLTVIGVYIFVPGNFAHLLPKWQHQTTVCWLGTQPLLELTLPWLLFVIFSVFFCWHSFTPVLLPKVRWWHGLGHASLTRYLCITLLQINYHVGVVLPASRLYVL